MLGGCCKIEDRSCGNMALNRNQTQYRTYTDQRTTAAKCRLLRHFFSLKFIIKAPYADIIEIYGNVTLKRFN